MKKIPVALRNTAAELPKHGLKVTQASDIKDTRLEWQADVVVIGSGAGGGIAAYELAKAGKKVIVIEAGPYVPSENFTEMLAVSMGQLYADHGGQNNDTGDIAMLQGACVGGSTVVNAALCFRTPDHYLHAWGNDFGLTNLTPAVMKPYFERVEKNLRINTVVAHETSAGAELIANGLKKLKLPRGQARRNVKDCVMTGACFSGCASDRKQSMLVTYLPWAVSYGAQIVSDTRVVRINTVDGRASGVEAEVIDQATGQKKADLIVKAPMVILAAGPIQSPILLQRSGIANSSGQVGKNFACHPTMSVTGVFEQDVNDFYGATHSLYMDKYTLPGAGGYLLLNAVQDPVEASTQVEPGTGKPFVSYMSHYRNTIRLISLIHDKNVGEVSWENGVKHIRYDVDDGDFEAMKQGLITTCRVLWAAGAKTLHIPASNKIEITREEDIVPVVSALRNEKARYRYTSFHPQGTCRMGADPKRTVVNPQGETHDVKNLYVADASLLPTSIGYNPSETVYALAHYIVDGITGARKPAKA